MYTDATLEEGKDMVTAKVSQKGQIVIPAHIRRQIGIQPGSEVIIEPSERGVLILPLTEGLNQRECPFDAEPAFGLWRDDPRTDEEILDELGGNWTDFPLEE